MKSSKSASYLDLLINIDNKGKLQTKIYDKRDDFNFPIVNFPFLAVIYLFLLRMAYMFHNLYAMLELHLVMKIFLTGENCSQKSWWIRDTFSPGLFRPSKNSMVVISILSANMACPYLYLLQICLTPFSCMLFPITTHLYIYYKSVTGAACGAGDAHPSGAPDLTSRCLGVHALLY